MLTYSYKARNDAGQMVSGELTGDSEQEIVAQLRQKGYVPVNISQNSSAKSKTPAASFLSGRISFMPKRVKTRDLVVFCTNLSSMSNAGVPLLNSLNLISEQLPNPYLSEVVRKVAQKISDGSSFSESLSIFPKVFSNFFVNMIRAGEVSGTLDSVLKELSEYLEKQDSLRQTIRGMLIYPAVLMVACIAVVVLMCTFLMPQFVNIFTRSGVPLPLPTKLLYGVGVWIRAYPLYYIPFMALLFYAIKTALNTSRGKVFFDRTVLKVPVLGELINRSLIVRFCRTLATLLDTGVPMLQGFKILQQIIGNTVFVDIIGQIYVNVEKGEGIHKALLSREEFPKDATYMISVGEKTGNIGLMLNKIADFYEIKVQHQVKGLIVLIEPVFVVVLGAVVGLIMASILLPMFDMIKTIQK